MMTWYRYAAALAEAKSKTGETFFLYQPALDYEIRSLAMAVGDDVAFGHGFIRISGTLKNGNPG